MGEARDLVVMFGGPSAEHEVSCVSAYHVTSGSRRGGRRVILVGLTHDTRWVDMSASLETMEEFDAFPSPDVVVAEDPTKVLPDLGAHLSRGADAPVIFPLLHGPFGEDGVAQGHFEALGIPYVGAGVLSSALCMDKAVAKSVLRDHGLPVAAWRVLRRSELTTSALEEVIGALGFPVFVKPANLGSSIGVSKVTTTEELRDAVELAWEFDDYAILEEFVDGREVELAALGNQNVQVTVAGEVIASREFYDYEDKYELGAAKIIVPAELSPADMARAQELATGAYAALRVEGLARIDLFMTPDGSLLINEVNTMPGFTPISMFPMLWQHSGLPLPALIDELVTLAMERHVRRRGLRKFR
ncbi:MAG TPA: D-alanine--D-alanine ligase family protein [Acidimicrobiales bacterium]|nr:D-alanine--D-alanine ligase family protein [Acidimicrobiales bacterium]